ncbi:MAG: hypothetical protein Fur0014_11070 [Rubrivivax sp.]
MPRTPLLSLLLAATGAAAQTSPWYLGASVGVAHEDNVYRLADGVAAPAGVSKSDTITTAALLAGLDQPVGRQRVYGNATLRDSRFDRNRVLDNQGYALRAGMDWSTAERVSGNLDLRVDRSLARFNTDTEIGLITRRNIEQVRQAAASVRVGVVTEYSLEAGLERREVDYSAPEYAPRENRVNTATAGLRWRPSAGLMLGGGLRHVRGIYPQFEPLAGGGFRADRFTRDGLDLLFELTPGGASRFDGRVTLGRTRYEAATARDFSGVTGAARWVWQPGAKLQLTTRLTRDDGQSGYYSTSPLVDGVVDYSRTTTVLSLRGDYTATAKLRFNAVLAAGRRDLVRTLPPTALVPGDASGRENTLEATLGLSWDPTRRAVLGCDLGHERRTGRGELARPYRAGRIACYGQIFLR